MDRSAVDKHFLNHHGVLSRIEARALGMTPGAIGARVRTGEWVVIAPGVYAHAAAPHGWLSRARAAALSGGGVLSHRAAAALWQIDGWRPGSIEIVVSEGQYRRRAGVTVHQSRQYGLADATQVRGVPVTGLARTVLDVAAVVPFRRLEWTVDAVVRQRLATWPDLYSVLVRHSARGRNGCGPLRALLEERYGDQAVPDSKWNRMVGAVLVDAGLPAPRYEHEIRDAKGFVGRVDLAYPAQRVAIECDSVRFHLNRQSFVADPRRKNRLLLAGWVVLTFTWSDYAERPVELVSTVRSALASRRFPATG